MLRRVLSKSLIKKIFRLDLCETIGKFPRRHIGIKSVKEYGSVCEKERENRIVSENERKETVYFDGGETSKLGGIKLWQR